MRFIGVGHSSIRCRKVEADAPHRDMPCTMTQPILYRISLTFTVLKETGHLQGFLDCVGSILGVLCSREITLTILYVEKPRPNQITLDVEIHPPPADGVSDEDMLRLGIRDPAETRASAALLVWLASLRRLGAGPLQAAWATYCRQRDIPANPCPVFLLAHGIRRLQT